MGWAGQHYDNSEQMRARCDAVFWYWQKKWISGYIDEDEDMYWIDRLWRSIVQNNVDEMFGGKFQIYEELLK